MNEYGLPFEHVAALAWGHFLGDDSRTAEEGIEEFKILLAEYVRERAEIAWLEGSLAGVKEAMDVLNDSSYEAPANPYSERKHR